MTSATPTSLWRNVRRWLPGVIISVVALFLVFRVVTFQDLGKAMAAVQAPSLILVIAISIVSMVVRGGAWKVLLGNRPSITQCFFIINEGYLLNNLFPLKAGEIGRAVFMGKAIKISPFHVLSTIVIERAFDLIFAATLLLFTLPLALGLDWARSAGIATLLLMIALIAALFLMARFTTQVHTIALKIGGRWKLFNRYVIPQVDSLLDGLSALTNARQFFLSFALIGATWIFWISIYYVMIISIAPGAPVWWAMFADSLLALGVAIPSAPAGLGVYEAAMVLALTILGIAQPTALAIAIILHFTQFGITAVFGFWGILRERQSLSTLFSDIQIQQTKPTE
jgi:uncharacterized protein (TIRG00374 family)